MNGRIMFPFLLLDPLGPGERVQKNEVVDASIQIPNHPYHIDGLFMKRSSIPTLTEAGLFTTRAIVAGELIGFYSGHLITDDEYRAYSAKKRKILGRYALASAYGDFTISPIDPRNTQAGVDFQVHPLALANEPVKAGGVANAFASSCVVEAGDAEFACVCVFACSAIPPGGEIQWSYGDAYTRVGYEAGADCIQPKHRDDPLEMLLRTRTHPHFEFIAVRMPESSESESSHEEYGA
jgi:hypothetical protein